MVTIQSVGEGGCTLSGGEKQRLSIALCHAEILQIVLLDQATASLDPENEVEIQKAIDTLIKGRTVIVNTAIVTREWGPTTSLSYPWKWRRRSHSELMCWDGLYRKLWNIQESTLGWTL